MGRRGGHISYRSVHLLWSSKKKRRKKIRTSYKIKQRLKKEKKIKSQFIKFNKRKAERKESPCLLLSSVHSSPVLSLPIHGSHGFWGAPCRLGGWGPGWLWMVVVMMEVCGWRGWGQPDRLLAGW